MHPSPIKAAARHRSDANYAAYPSPIKAAARHRSEVNYAAHPSPIKGAARRRSEANYVAHPSPLKAAARRRLEANYAAHPPLKEAVRCWLEANYKSNESCCYSEYYKKLLQRGLGKALLTPQKKVSRASCVEIDTLWLSLNSQSELCTSSGFNRNCLIIRS